jgi:2'-5' RNA ligase
VSDLLREFVQEIKEIITSKYDLWWNMPQPYTPHVTLAFRDLTEEGYDKGRAYLQKEGFRDVITVSHIALVENLPDKDSEYRRFYYGENRPT